MARLTTVTQDPTSLEQEESMQTQQQPVGLIGQQQQQQTALQRAGSLGESFTTGAADIIGLPGTLVNAALDRVGLGEYRQFGDSDSLRELGSRLGITMAPGESPETIPERIAYEIGAVSLPTAGVLRLGRSAYGAEGIRRGASETLNKVGGLTNFARSTAQNPNSLVAWETTAAASAGLGGWIGNELLPDSDTAETVGQLTGGFAPAVAYNLSPTGAAVRLGRFVTSPLTGDRSADRAARRLQSEVADPMATVAELDRLSGSGLTPSRATGEENLIGLENAVRRKYPEVDKQIRNELDIAVDDLIKEANQIGSVAGRDRVTEILTNHREYLLKNLEVEAAKAGEAYAYALSRLGDDVNSRQIQVAFNDTVGKAYDSARATERQLWGAIDSSAPASLENSRSFINKEIALRSEAADPQDIPGYVTALTRRKTADDVDSVIDLPASVRQQVANLQDSDRVDVRFVQDFRSRVLQDIRAERAKDAPNRNKIRILSNLQENLLEDMQSVSGQSDTIDSALSYSRDLNQRFMQGRVGRMMGFERTGGSVIAPEDSIDFILKGGTPTTNVQRVLSAVPETQENLSDFLKNQYAVTSVTPEGTINTRRSNRFFEKYSSIIDSIPGLRSELEGAGQRGARLDQLLQRKNALEKVVRDPKRSSLSLWLNEPVEDAMNAMFRSKNPAVVAANLRRRVQSDPEALKGLQSAYTEHVLRSGKTARLDQETGESILDGAKMLSELQNTRVGAKALGLTDTQLDRAQEIALSISRANRNGPPAAFDQKGKIVGDFSNYFLDSIAALVGARAGAQIGGVTAGGSIQAASRGSSVLQRALRFLTKDKAEELLVDAMTDEQLYRDLLIRPSSSPVRKDRLGRRINAYIPSAAGAETRGLLEEDQQQQEGPRLRTLEAEQ